MRTSRLVVLMTPDWRGSNPYQGFVADAVTRSGDVEVRFANSPRGLLPMWKLCRANRQARVLHLHWLNHLVEPICWSANRVRRAIKIGLFIVDLALVKARGIRTVWTVHNRVEHESLRPSTELLIRSLLARLVDHVIFHSESAMRIVRQDLGERALKSGRVSVIRHGHFIGCYSQNPQVAADLRSRWELKPEHVVVLFFGNIRPYKGVERLLTALSQSPRRDLRVVIAGAPWSDELTRQLERAAADDPRIRLNLSNIPDADVASYFEIADVVAIPFIRTLSSSSAILAMSLGRTMILPIDASVLDVGTSDTVIYYRDGDDLARVLNELDKTALAEMGRKQRVSVSEFDWDSVGRRTLATYH